MSKKYSTQSGYSLMEAVVYVALFVGLSVCLIDVTLILSKSYTEVRVNRDLLDSSQALVERMSREIRTAKSIDATSALDTDPGSLLLHTTDASGTARTMAFALTSGVLYVKDNGGAPVALSGQDVSVSSLVFHSIALSEGAGVRFEITLQSLRSASHKTINLSDTVVMRGGY